MDPTTQRLAMGAGAKTLLAPTAIAVSHATSPCITTYPWSGSGFGTKFSDPATLPGGTGYGVAFT